MLRRIASLVLSLSAALAVGTALAPAPVAVLAAAPGSAVASKAAFHDAMRRLWEDHIIWTRQFIVSAATEPANLPDLAPTVERLLANQTDIGDAIARFFGAPAGDRLTSLLRDHILTAAQLVFAAKAGDAAAVQSASTAWYANANDIASFLHGLDPRQWPLADLQAMMKSHLDLTLAEAVARLQARYADDIAAYDQVHDEILSMADMLSDGIIAQFPQKFAS